jgi:CDGSH-type Zn-finger protein
VDAADAAEIASAIRLCPTGALKFQARNGFPDEEPDDVTTVRAGHLGPLYMRGRVRLVDGHGRLIAEETRVALCRCGASSNKPYCDNSHRMLRKDRAWPEPEG